MEDHTARLAPDAFAALLNEFAAECYSEGRDKERIETKRAQLVSEYERASRGRTSLGPEIEWYLIKKGMTLEMVQGVERIFGQTMHMIFGLESFLSIEELERLDAEARKKTLGQLIAKLRERVQLEPKFDEILSRFVEDRNEFIHRAKKDTPEDEQRQEALIARLNKVGSLLMQTFISFILAFSERVGVSVPMPERPDPVLIDALADSKRVWGLVSGPLQVRVFPKAFDDDV
jgi:hypothetical protein